MIWLRRRILVITSAMILLRGWVLACLTTLSLPGQGATAPIGVEATYRLDLLPVLRTPAKVASVSSYDRSGGNDDGFSGTYSFVRKDPEGLVLADLKGPGVIYRIWTPTPTDDILEFLFDGEPQPRLALKFRDLFLGKHPLFPAPLAGFGGGGYYCYVPLPFSQSCVVRMRASKVQFYQINYELYGSPTSITTFDPNASEADRDRLQKACTLWNSSGTDVSRYTIPPVATAQLSSSTVLVAPHSTAGVFEAKQGGRIAGLRLSPASVISGKGRDLLLRISFDGEQPSVFCPLGDFFGYAWGKPAMKSLLVGTAGETNYCYFPMPFDRAALIEIVSERNTPVQLHAEVWHAPAPRTREEGKFYALWRRENPSRLGEPYTFLETEGHGQVVGVVLQAQGFESGKTLFFEGDDETTIDGELAIHGTGSEDFFNGGWYDVPDRWEKQISFPLSGCLGYAKYLGRTGGYRFFLGDALSYRRSVRQTIEHAGEKNSILTDYCSVTYFYSELRPSAELAPPALAQRAVHDLQEILFPAWWQLPIYAWSFERASLTRQKEKIDGEEVRFLSLRATGQDWFGPHFLSPTVDLPSSDLYRIYLEVVRGPGQAKVQLFQNENPVAEPVDLFAEKAGKSGRVLLGQLRLAEGKNNLMIKLVGKNERSVGLGLDLISVVCVRGE